MYLCSDGPRTQLYNISLFLTRSKQWMPHIRHLPPQKSHWNLGYILWKVELLFENFRFITASIWRVDWHIYPHQTWHLPVTWTETVIPCFEIPSTGSKFAHQWHQQSTVYTLSTWILVAWASWPAQFSITAYSLLYLLLLQYLCSHVVSYLQKEHNTFPSSFGYLYALSDNSIWSEVSVMTIEHTRVITTQCSLVQQITTKFPMKIPNWTVLHVQHRGHCCIKFLLRDLVELTNRLYCHYHIDTLINRLPVMMTPIGSKELNTKTWTVQTNRQETRMPFSRGPTSHLPIESKTLTIWPSDDLDLVYDFDLRQVKLS